MDSISSYEFHKIFDRVSGNINLQGKLSVNDIDKELVKAREKKRFGCMLGTSYTPFIVFTESSPKVDSLYLPSSILDTSSPRFSR